MGEIYFIFGALYVLVAFGFLLGSDKVREADGRGNEPRSIFETVTMIGVWPIAIGMLLLILVHEALERQSEKSDENFLKGQEDRNSGD